MDTLNFLRTPAKRKTRKDKKIERDLAPEIDTSDEAIHRRALALAVSKKTSAVEKSSQAKLEEILKKMRKQDSFKGVQKITRVGSVTAVEFKDSKAFFIPRSMGGQTFERMGFNRI